MLPIAALALEFGPELIRGAKSLLGLGGRAGAIADTAADIVAAAGGDKKIIESELSNLPKEDQLELYTLLTDLEKARFTHAENMAAIETDKQKGGQELWKHDTALEDRFTSRARPSGLYLMYAVIGVALIVIPIITAWKTGKPETLTLPAEFWWAFGSAFVGYSYLRSAYDKTRKPRPGLLEKATKLIGLGGKP